MWRASTIALALIAPACHAPRAPAPAPVGQPADAGGVTTCGQPVPPPPRPARFAAEPALEPMPGQPTPPAPPRALPPPSPDPGAIDRAMHRQLPFLRACAVRFYDRHHDEGSLHLDARLAVEADGRVSGATVAGGGAELDRCVCERLVAMEVPGVGARTVVDYPLIMSP